MDKNQRISRKDFLKRTATGLAMTAASPSAFGQIFPGRVLGANDRVNMGFIGVGNRGSLLLRLFMEEKSCQVGALCDVYKPYRDRDKASVDRRILDFCKSVPSMGEQFSGAPERYDDYRRLLDNRDIDAVCIATPDHWHALQAIDAMHAEKDVYVEKPLSLTVVEGRRMVQAQRHTGRVAAVGLNRRGCPVYQKLAREVPAGKIGKVSVAGAARVSNMYRDGIGNFKPDRVPSGFDWNQWLGPAAYREWQLNIAPYYFRWWKEYSSQMGNWGVHYMDVIRWMLGEQAPVTIQATGGKYVLNDDRNIPDSMQIAFEFASGAVVNFAIYEATSSGLFRNGEVELRGTKGVLQANEKGYHVFPTKAGQNQKWPSEQLIREESWSVKDIRDLGDGSNANSTQVLVQNFLDCVKSRAEPLCPLEEGHRSTSFAHLANIALATGVRLKWDAVKEQFTNSHEANDLLHYQYRAPWKLKG